VLRKETSNKSNVSESKIPGALAHLGFFGVPYFQPNPFSVILFPQTLATLGVLIVGVKTGCSFEVVAKRAPIQTSIEIEISSRDLAKRPRIGSFYRDLVKRHL